MTMKRRFDPPLTYGEIAKVYDFTRYILSDILGMPQWRIQVLTEPSPRHSYATIVPAEDKHVGELALHSAWESLDLEAERIPTLVHECMHLTHHELTYNVTGNAFRFVPSACYGEFNHSWKHAIELWTDHMSQVILGLASEQIEKWAEEIWGSDWKETETKEERS